MKAQSLTQAEQLHEVLDAFSERAKLVLDELMTLATEPAPGRQLRDATGEAQLRELRAAMPRRRLRFEEGLQIAERQAELLRWQLGRGTTAALPTNALSGLPFLQVLERTNLAKSGLLTHTERGWIIVLHSDEPEVRKRFSLCHELKHLFDDEFAAQLPGGLYPAYGGYSADDLAERVCDHFAGALLMPKLLVRRDWTSGLQDSLRLARRFQVSKAAMEVRLWQLGLREPTPRCGHALSTDRSR